LVEHELIDIDQQSVLCSAHTGYTDLTMWLIYTEETLLLST